MRPGIGASEMRCGWWLVTIMLLGAASSEAGQKMVVLGFDGLDPVLLQEFRDEGVLPHFDAFVARGGTVAPLATSVPPQSPVAWSNFITGMDSGGHGIFDFIHRDPATLQPYFSTSEAKGATRFWRLGRWQIPRGRGSVANLRHGTAFWELLSDAGLDVTIFKVPSNFPPVECEVRSLSGMGTPDLTGNYGISTLITNDPPLERDIGGGRIVSVYLDGDTFQADLEGPVNTWRQGSPRATVPVLGRWDQQSHAVWLTVAGTEVVLEQGQWSDWVTVDFSMIPLLKGVRGICRFYLIEAEYSLQLYVTPLQIDPAKPEMPISTPRRYSRQIVERTGLFYTQGLPDDTSALENGFFDDKSYVRQSELVLQERLAQLRAEVDRFQKVDRGLLFFYFNSPDQTCHMMWRGRDTASPTHVGSDPDYRGRIREVYRELDEALGATVASLDAGTTVLVMSDHGFAPWNRAFHLNTWLYHHGYLVLEKGRDPADVQMLSGVDWKRTRAYAVGINGLYLNLAGREANGVVAPGREREALLRQLQQKLEAVIDPLDGRPAIKDATRADRVYHGPYRDTGPDIIVGYFRGWRGSNESALGRVMADEFTDNLLKWSGDHCIAADEVPGVILANRPLVRRDPALVDLAPTILEYFGVPVPPEMVGGDLFKP